ncbi:MAG TPA: DNA internalization-related competence protein ComEC/Rec2, partial [bacterium]|nr:DNA internalization-related competence protein ComEC/Rec2 [bacterium]
RIRVASPWPGPVPEDVSENDRSLMVRWRCGRRRALLLGDGGHRTEAAWLAAAADSGVPTDSLRSHVMAVPHHGSRESTGEALLAVVRPALAVVSCATGNPHGHPHRETLERLAAAATAVLRTDRDGTVTLTASPAGFRVRWERDFPGPLALLPAFPLSGSRRFP